MKLQKGLKETQQSATRRQDSLVIHGEEDDNTIRQARKRAVFNVAWECRLSCGVSDEESTRCRQHDGRGSDTEAAPLRSRQRLS